MKKLLLCISLCLVAALCSACSLFGVDLRDILNPDPSRRPAQTESPVSPYPGEDLCAPDALQDTDFPVHLILPEQRETEPFRYLRDGDTSAMKTRTVETGEDLFNAAESGYKPVCAAGSNAEILYLDALRVLDAILRNDMTEYERVHAIYDWLIYTVQYDYDILAVYEKDPNDPSFEDAHAFDLRGVFYDRLAVCDGISKAFALMCRIENIECVQVVGYAGDEGGEKDIGHAWNKVRIHSPLHADCEDGLSCTESSHRKWYICDPTWGNLGVGDGQEVDTEILTHAYFLVSDAQMNPTHEEHPEEDANDSYYPRATSDYGYYAVSSLAFGPDAPAAEGEMESAAFSAKVTSAALFGQVMSAARAGRRAFEVQLAFPAGWGEDYDAMIRAYFRAASGYWVGVTDSVYLIKFE